MSYFTGPPWTLLRFIGVRKWGSGKIGQITNSLLEGSLLAVEPQVLVCDFALLGLSVPVGQALSRGEPFQFYVVL